MSDLTRNPSPRTALEGFGMICAGVLQLARGIPEIIKWIKWKDVFWTLLIVVGCAVVAVALSALLKLTGNTNQGLWP